MHSENLNFAMPCFFHYDSEIHCLAKIIAPVFLMFLIPNDLVLFNYHFVPIVITYFRHFWYFTQLGWLYKPPYNFCNPNFSFYASFPVAFAFRLDFTLFSLLFSHFLGCQTRLLRMTTQGMLG